MTMGKIYVLILGLFFGNIVPCLAQPVYNFGSFASNGDTFYLSKAQLLQADFDRTGANITWDFSQLTGVSQRRLVFRAPSQTGFTLAQWPYIFNSNNVNSSSSDGSTTAVFGLQQTNPNDYYLSSGNLFRQKASSYTIIAGSVPLNVRNVYTRPDTIYAFPLQYGGTHHSEAAYTIQVTDLYYRDVQLQRLDTVTGWGMLKTPYGTFSQVLQYMSYNREIDSVAVNGSPLIQNDTFYSRTISWFDPSRKFPVLTVHQTRTAGVFVTNDIEYMDQKIYYPPQAAFAWVPVQPNAGDTVYFQNLSTNAESYQWNFGDGSAVESEMNPQHIYSTPGIYRTSLIVRNGNLADTFSADITVLPVNTTYTFTGNGNWSDSGNWQNHQVPPATLPATNHIVIHHAPGGSCTLDVSQRIVNGASLTVNSGMRLIINGQLRLQ